MQVPQLPQTSYQALNMPYAFFGLRWTNNYIENLSTGVALEMVIPNSKLVINPGMVENELHKELYLHPRQWIPWVGLMVVGTMVALAGVVLVLHLNEKVPFFTFLWMMLLTPDSYSKGIPLADFASTSVPSYLLLLLIWHPVTNQEGGKHKDSTIMMAAMIESMPPLTSSTRRWLERSKSFRQQPGLERARVRLLTFVGAFIPTTHTKYLEMTQAGIPDISFASTFISEQLQRPPGHFIDQFFHH
jgi:hypothetical protein